MKTFEQLEVLDSKKYKIGVSTFNTPLDHFKELMEFKDERFDFKIQGTHKMTNVNDDGSENTSFGRTIMEHKFKLDKELTYTIGVVLAMDRGKAIAKIYTGLKVVACSNLCIFNAEQIYTFSLAESQEKFKEFYLMEFAKVEEKIKKYKLILDKLKSIHLEHKKIKLLNGSIIENMIENGGKAGTTPVLNGIREQRNPKSIYFSDNGLSAWLYYNSLTEYLNLKVHPIDIPEKALHLFEVLKDELKFNFEEEKVLSIN